MTFGDLSQHHGLAPLPGAAFDFNQVIEPPKLSTLYVSMESKTANIPQVFMITWTFICAGNLSTGRNLWPCG